MEVSNDPLEEEIDLIGQGLRDINNLDLSRLMMCKVINLHFNRLENLRGLPSMLPLTEINLSSNNFTTCDIPELAQLPSLTLLDLSGNKIKSLTALPFLPGLLKLHIAHNFITSLYGVEENIKNIEYLDIRGNYIARKDDLTPINTLKSLKLLQIGGTQPNPVCQKVPVINDLFKICPSLEEIDGLNSNDWNSAELMFVPTPHFDSVAKRFHSRNSPKREIQNFSHHTLERNRSKSEVDISPDGFYEGDSGFIEGFNGKSMGYEDLMYDMKVDCFYLSFGLILKKWRNKVLMKGFNKWFLFNSAEKFLEMKKKNIILEKVNDEKNENYESKIRDLNNLLKEEKMKFNNNKSKNVKLESKVMKLMKENENFEGNYKNMVIEQQQILEKLRESQESLNKMKIIEKEKIDRLEILEQTINEKDKLIKNLENKINSSEFKNNENNNELSFCRERLKGNEILIENLKNEVKLYQTQVSELLNKNDNLENDLNILNDESKLKDNKKDVLINELQNQISVLEEKLKNWKEKDFLQVELKGNYEEKNKEIQLKWEQQLTASEFFRKENVKLKHQNEKDHKTIKELGKIVKKLQKSLEIYKMNENESHSKSSLKENELLQEISKLQNSLHNESNNAETLEQRLNEIEQLYEDLQKNYESCASHLRKTEENYVNLQNQNNELKINNQVKERIITDKGLEIQNLEETKKDYEQHFNDLQSIIYELEKKLDKKRNIIENLEHELQVKWDVEKKLKKLIEEFNSSSVDISAIFPINELNNEKNSLKNKPHDIDQNPTSRQLFSPESPNFQNISPVPKAPKMAQDETVSLGIAELRYSASSSFSEEEDLEDLMGFYVEKDLCSNPICQKRLNETLKTLEKTKNALEEQKTKSSEKIKLKKEECSRMNETLVKYEEKLKTLKHDNKKLAKYCQQLKEDLDEKEKEFIRSQNAANQLKSAFEQFQTLSN